ncbi:MAG: hypothetical protein JNL70_23395 [Saprospiraceae bacterium]|nr:hypothetical protein [Saprospiraceae bacterium]
MLRHSSACPLLMLLNAVESRKKLSCGVFTEGVESRLPYCSTIVQREGIW